MLVYIKTSYNVPIRNKTIPQSKIEKLSMKQKFKLYFLLTLRIKVYDLSENAAKQI